MRRKFWKILGISVLLVAFLTTAAVAAFVYNPFEGTLTDIRELVPRDIDYFLRKSDLKDDFASFPEPHFWRDLTKAKAWGEFKRGPLYRSVERELGVAEIVEELRRTAAEVAASSAGMADILEDGFGRELILVGKVDPATMCILTRVSWKGRFLWGLLQWRGIRERFTAQGVQIDAAPDGTLTVKAANGRTFFAQRHLDCVLLADDKGLLDQSVALAVGRAGADSFGRSSDYRDGVEGRIRDWEKQTEVRANALELYARPDRVFGVTRFDDNWPNPRHPDDMNQRVLASFLNLTGWRFTSAALVFEPKSLTLLGRIEVNRNLHTGFQTQFFKTEPQERKLWLDPFLSMVPEGACAAAAMRVPAGDFISEMYDALDADLRELFNDVIRKTGKYDGVRALIDSLRLALEPRIGFVFFRSRSLGPEVFSNEPSPAPHIAWVFWIRESDRPAIKGLFDFLTQNSQTLGFSKAYDLPVRLGSGDATREFINPNIPGTGEVAVLVYGNFFVVSNSSYLIRDMINARTEGRSILQFPDYLTFEKEMPTRVNGFIFVQGERMADVIQDYLDDLDKGAQGRDPEWELNNRSRLEQQVLREKFPSHSSVASLPREQRDAFEAELDRAMESAWRDYRSRAAVGDRDRLEQARALMRMFTSAYMQLNLDPQAMQLTSRILMDYR